MTDLAYADDYGDSTIEADEPTDEGLRRIIEFADTPGDISHLLTPDELSSIGQRVAEDWERDKKSCESWRKGVEDAFKQAAQEKDEAAKTVPWDNASDVDFPLLTVAAGQFTGRASPALVKGDEAVGVKVFGEKPEPLPQDTANVPPDQLPHLKALFEANEKWGKKTARAKRVKTYLNYLLFYGMDGWEDELDTLLTQLPIAGTAFKEVYYDPDRGTCSEYLNPLRFTVDMKTTSLKRCPRMTKDFDLYPYEIEEKQAKGDYNPEIVLIRESDDPEAPRLILQQHRLHDMDDDGIPEPYIITVDSETQQVLRIEAAYDQEDLILQGDKIVRIERYVPFVKYPFMRDPQGRFYEIGFGQLLKSITAVINTAINQMTDAATAQIRGGGFVASGLRLQGPGQSSDLKWRLGEYKVVSAPGGDLRNAVWERTLPQVSPITFQLLELMLGAAKEVANLKDVLTGEAPSTAPVGTTLALIEQGLQAFTAIYKRVYRAMREEFQLIYQCEARWGGEKSAQTYADILDDPEADFQADFSLKGMDITPISDPTVVTRQQQMAKAQVIQQAATVFPDAINHAAAAKRIFEAADIDSPEELIAVQGPPPPAVVAEIENTQADTVLKKTAADLNEAKAAQAQGDTLKKVAEAGAVMGEHHQEGLMDGIQGGLGRVEGAPGNAVDIPGPGGGGGSAEGGMAAPVVGGGESGPLDAPGAIDPG